MRTLIAALCLTPTLAMAAPGEKLLHSFGGPDDGTFPTVNTLVSDAAGTFYGAAPHSGANGFGAVYSLAPPAAGKTKWTYTILHQFAAGEGNGPYGSLLPEAGGALVGATVAGGSFSQGTVYRLTPPATPGAAWTLQTLWNFTGGSDGAQPYQGVIAGKAGVLYGTTYLGGLTGAQGGGSGNGVVYALSPPASAGGAYTETVLYSFTGTTGSITDGSGPIAGVRRGADGSLYGTAESGGLLGITAGCSLPSGCGVVFRLTPSGGTWHETLLHLFGGTPQDGASPEGAVSIGADGTLYGATAFGGADANASLDRGVVYALTPPAGGSGPWAYTVLKEMAQAPDFLSFPIGDLALSKSGTLYGAAVDGGPAGAAGLATSGGGIFKLTPPATPGAAWSYSVAHVFTADSGDFCKSGCYPYAGPTLTAKGAVISTTLEGGAFPMPASHVGGGVIFELK